MQLAVIVNEMSMQRTRGNDEFNLNFLHLCVLVGFLAQPTSMVLPYWGLFSILGGEI